MTIQQKNQKKNLQESLSGFITTLLLTVQYTQTFHENWERKCLKFSFSHPQNSLPFSSIPLYPNLNFYSGFLFQFLNKKSIKKLKTAKQKSPSRWNLITFAWLIKIGPPSFVKKFFPAKFFFCILEKKTLAGKIYFIINFSIRILERV